MFHITKYLLNHKIKFELKGILVSFLLSSILLQYPTDKEDNKLIGKAEEKGVRYVS